MFKPFPKYTAANKCASIYGVTTEGIRQQNRTKRIKKERSVYNSLERICLRVYMMALDRVKSICALSAHSAVKGICCKTSSHDKLSPSTNKLSFITARSRIAESTFLCHKKHLRFSQRTRNSSMITGFFFVLF